MEIASTTECVTHVPEHPLPMSPVYTVFEGRGERRENHALSKASGRATRTEIAQLIFSRSLISAHAERNRRVVQTLNDPATAPSILVKHLDDADTVVRYAARTALERIPVEKWRALVLAPSPERSIHGLLALARGLDPKDVQAIITAVQSIDPARLPVSTR